VALTVRVRRATGQFVQSVSDELVTPLPNFAGEVDLFGMGSKVFGDRSLPDGRFVSSELLEKRPDFVVDCKDIFNGGIPERVRQSLRHCVRACVTLATDRSSTLETTAVA
jgi:hypothetical protein